MRNPYMKFQNPSHGFWRTDARTDKPNQYAPVGGTIKWPNDQHFCTHWLTKIFQKRFLYDKRWPADQSVVIEFGWLTKVFKEGWLDVLSFKKFSNMAKRFRKIGWMSKVFTIRLAEWAKCFRTFSRLDDQTILRTFAGRWVYFQTNRMT